MIRTRGLTKQYGAVRAVDGVGLDVREGDVYGFLGANGSGKTTTVRMLLGLVLPTSGAMEVLGSSMPAARAQVLPRVGALVEGPGAHAHLSGRTNLDLLDRAGRDRLATGARAERITEVLAEVGLDPADRRPVRTYSLGMRQRLGLAAALLRRPALLVLDEPTNGLDPQGIGEIRDLLLRLNAAGTTVFLSSHLLAEVEQLCTRVGVIDRGRLVLQEPLEGLLTPPGVVAVSTPETGRAASLLGRRVLGAEPGRLLVESWDPAALNAELVGAGVPVTAFGPWRRELEQVVREATAVRRDPVLPDPPEDAAPAGTREYLSTRP
ncbi:ABC-2 type transport system ATP-binding protein [Friedmanniella endophytica]|uniref:ABC-2 type transport system ATP-binding protein n=1 Tax=Microlunatus kandeliicorticis TaxID=1759536 RepID=A0A7W3IP38_9ACTN|nr:ATP-binding cassette domain-containing protein [Microlunatus kandeliicorticis]MBA8792632.1 ABC-2 type transport system ATP-binding protein [Microlunatus kandeliicorticis]